MAPVVTKHQAAIVEPVEVGELLRATWHGFSTIASTCLNELGWNPDLIELRLAHAERNEVRGAYNHAQRLAERRQLMQAWAHYLDGLRKNTANDAAEIATPGRFSPARSG